MLNLYEAAYLCIHGEEILDETIAFNTTHLKSMVADHVCPNPAQQINHASCCPLRKAAPILEVRFFLELVSL